MATYTWHVYSGGTEVGGATLNAVTRYTGIGVQQTTFSMNAATYTAYIWTDGRESYTNLIYNWYVNGDTNPIKKFYTVGVDRDISLTPSVTLNTSDYFNSNNPNESSRTFTLTVGPYTTYYNGTLKDTSEHLLYTYEVTLNAPPTFNSTTISFDTEYIYAGLTTASVSISDLSAKYGGNISSAVLKIGNYVSESITTDDTLSLELTESGIFTPQIIVTDSRGQTTIKNFTEITVKEYTPASVILEDINRTDLNGIAGDEGTSAILTAKFNYLNDVTSLIQPIILVKNIDGSTLTPTPIITWYQNWNRNTGYSQLITDWSIIENNTSIYAFIDDKDGQSETGVFDTQYSYNIEVTPKDEYGSGETKSVTLGSAFYTVDFLAGGHGIAFGQSATKEGFYCSMDSYIHIDPNDDAGLYQALQALDPTMLDSEDMAPLKTILFKALTWG